MILILAVIGMAITFILGQAAGHAIANKNWELAISRPTKELHSLVNRNFEWMFWSSRK